MMGIKTPEYTFAYLDYVHISGRLLISMKDRSQVIIAAIIARWPFFSVALAGLPWSNCRKSDQSSREDATTQGYYKMGRLSQLTQEPEKDRGKDYRCRQLPTNMENPETSSWFDNHLNDSSVFRNKLDLNRHGPIYGRISPRKAYRYIFPYPRMWWI